VYGSTGYRPGFFKNNKKAVGDASSCDVYVLFVVTLVCATATAHISHTHHTHITHTSPAQHVVDPMPIKQTVRNTFGEFWRTHQVLVLLQYILFLLQYILFLLELTHLYSRSIIFGGPRVFCSCSIYVLFATPLLFGEFWCPRQVLVLLFTHAVCVI